MDDDKVGSVEEKQLLTKMCQMFPSQSSFEFPEFNPCKEKEERFARPPKKFTPPYCKVC